jgi:hypothetical protein
MLFKKGMQHLRRLYFQLRDRLNEWRAKRTLKTAAVLLPDFIAYEPTLSRDVSRAGVRFYSLCGSCGARLASSATLCEECAQKRSGFSGLY